VPFIISKPTPDLAPSGLRNFDIFDAALNYTRNAIDET